MIQSFDMVLWARAKKTTLEEMTDTSLQLLCKLKEYGEELAPNYLPAKKKSLVKKFDLSEENVKAQLEKGVNKADFGGQIFEALGRIISFFSSLEDGLSSGIRITVGTSDKRFHNTLVVSLPYERFSGFTERRDEFEALFKRLISIFEPYFAFIPNSQNEQISDDYWKDGKPTYAHWMNYYDKATAKTIGLDKVRSVNGVEKLADGYFYKLQDEPLDVDNSQHLQKQREITEMLCL